MGDDDGGGLPEVLSSSADAPTAEERVRAAVADRGLMGWVRRHQLLLAGSFGVLLVAAGAVTYASTRPPPVDPVIRVSVVGFMGGGDNGWDAELRPRLAATYQVTAEVSGDANSVLGVTGPGLIAASSTIGDVLYGLPGVGDLGATIDCSDPSWWDAQDSDFQVSIQRTDAYGRVTVGGVPLGGTPVGRSDTMWHDDVVRTCLASYFRSLPPPSSATVSVGDGSQVDITLTLANPGDHDIHVMADYFAPGAMSIRPGPWTTIPAGARASLAISSTPVGCEDGSSFVPQVLGDDGTATADRGLPVRLSVDGSAADGVGDADAVVTISERESYGWVSLTPEFADEVDAALATLCGSQDS